MTDPERKPGTDPVVRLFSSWLSDREPFVVLDLTGRHLSALGRGAIDLSRHRPPAAEEIDAALMRLGYVLLDGGRVPRRSRALTLAATLGALQDLRARHGRPAWILVDDAQALPRGEVAPGPMPLESGGWCVAARDGAELPGWAVSAVPDAGGAGLRTTAPLLDLLLLPPAGADVRR